MSCETIPCKVCDGPPPVWRVLAYPDQTILHVADDYAAAYRWREANRQTAVILPYWKPL